MNNINFLIENETTLYQNQTKTKKHLFFKGVMSLVGYLKNDDGWVVTCLTEDKDLKLKTWKLVLNFDAFSTPEKFFKQLQDGVKTTVERGNVSKDVTLAFFQYLKVRYNNPLEFRLITHVGYIGTNNWFLSKELHVGRNFRKGNNIFVVPQSTLSDMELSVKDCLKEKAITVAANRRILYDIRDGYGVNRWNAEFAIAFTLGRLLLISTTDSVLESGESNILLLYGHHETGRNVGKTWLQHVLTYGQGADIQHRILLSGENTSKQAIEDVTNRSSMVVSLNDVTGKEAQAELCLHIYERLLHGCLSRGLLGSACAGLVMSSNFHESDRLNGRVIKLEFVQGDHDRKCLDNMLANSQKYKGFLISWVIHFGHIWQKDFRATQRSLSNLFKEIYPHMDERWIDSVAATVFTKMILFRSINAFFSLVDEALKLVATIPTTLPFWQRLEREIRRKIIGGQILTWLLPIGRINKPKDAIIIHVKAFQSFNSVTTTELQVKMQGIDSVISVGGIRFAKDESTTLEEIIQRDKEKVSTLRGHKLLLSNFSEEFNGWIKEAQKGIFGEITDLNDSDVTTMDNDCIEKLVNIESELNVVFSDFKDDIDQSMDDDNDDEIPPDVCLQIGDMSPKSGYNFKKGYKSCLDGWKLEGRRSTRSTENSNTTSTSSQTEMEHKQELEQACIEISPSSYVPDNFPPPGVFGAKAMTASAVSSCKMTSSTDEDVPDNFPPGVFGAKAMTASAVSSCKMTSSTDEDDENVDIIVTSTPIHQKEDVRNSSDNENAESEDVQKRRSPVKRGRKGKSKFCKCRKTRKASVKMIQCSGSKCPNNNWYHVKCENLKVKDIPPKGIPWYCSFCKQR